MSSGSSSGKKNRNGVTRRPITTTTDDTPDFDRGKVQLDVPDELFGNSFTLVTNVSKLAGEFIMVRAHSGYLTAEL